MIDVIDKHSKLIDTQDNKALINKKIELQHLKQQQEIILFKQNIETEDLEKQKLWLEARIKTKEQEKKAQERESAQFMYEFDKIDNEVAAIDKRMYLKKRYVTQHKQIKEMEARKKARAGQVVAPKKQTA